MLPSDHPEDWSYYFAQDQEARMVIGAEAPDACVPNVKDTLFGCGPVR